VLAGTKVFLSHIVAEDAALLAHWFADLELTALLGQQGRSFTLAQEQQQQGPIPLNTNVHLPSCCGTLNV
jgi:hypothetical protein